MYNPGLTKSLKLVWLIWSNSMMQIALSVYGLLTEALNQFIYSQLDLNGRQNSIRLSWFQQAKMVRLFPSKRATLVVHKFV